MAAAQQPQMHVYTGGIAMCNGYVIESPEGFIIIDAPAGITSWLIRKFEEPKVAHVLITHMHFDHVQDVSRLKKAFKCEVHAHSQLSDDLTLGKLAASPAEVDQFSVAPFLVDDVFGSRTPTANWGGLEWNIIHVPGHAIDGVAYSLPQQQMLFTGDILFQGSIGRTDFPYGSMKQLVNGINDKLMVLPLDTIVYPGHGASTSIKEESIINPYLS